MWKLIIGIVLTPFVLYITYSYYVMNSAQAGKEVEAKEVMNKRIEGALNDQKKAVTEGNFSEKIDDKILKDMNSFEKANKEIDAATDKLSKEVANDQELSTFDDNIVDERMNAIDKKFNKQKNTFNSSVDNIKMGE